MGESIVATAVLAMVLAWCDDGQLQQQQQTARIDDPFGSRNAARKWFLYNLLGMHSRSYMVGCSSTAATHREYPAAPVLSGRVRSHQLVLARQHQRQKMRLHMLPLSGCASCAPKRKVLLPHSVATHPKTGQTQQPATHKHSSLKVAWRLAKCTNCTLWEISSSICCPQR
jgi:hypothetical protein